MKTKTNNKGFSLVELIVVMAIMAILAVTLAPRLTHYIDKARQSNDREAVNTIYTAVKLALFDKAIYDEAILPAISTVDIATTPDSYIIKLKHGTSAVVGTDNGLYTVAGKVWTAGATTNKFLDEIVAVVDDFKLQSDLADDNSEIIITIQSQTLFKVELAYNDGTSTIDYAVNSNAVAVD